MIEEMNSLLSKEEDLHPDLVPYFEQHDKIPMLRHPLIFSLFHTPQLNAMINASYKNKKERVAKAHNEKRWSSYVFLHERPYRIKAFIQIMSKLTDCEYWKIFGNIWTDSENLWQYLPILKILLDSTRSDRNDMMMEDEQEFFSNLPKQFRIYRGHQEKNRKGYSWTLSYGKACWFSSRFDKTCKVVTALANKNDVIAIFLSRGEFEVVTIPNNLKMESVKKLVRPKKLEKVWKRAIAGNTSKCHGHLHWEKVEKHAILLAKSDKQVDETVVRLFAILHDCRRQNEEVDIDHGRRASEFARNLYAEGILPINEYQLEKLTNALDLHNDGKTSNDPTIGACWDSDRLDISRVGIIPDVKYLSTGEGKRLIWKV